MSRPNQRHKLPKHRSALGRKLLIAGMAVGMSFGPVHSASAGPAIDEFIHTIGCVGLLITDEAKHLEECGTNDNFGGPSVDFPTIPVVDAPPPPPPQICDSGQVLILGVCTTYTSPE